MGEPLSRVEAILQNILGADNILVPPGSQVEEILQAIYYSTEYEKNPKSRVAEILLAIKNKGIYDGPVLSRVEDILVHKLNGIPYTKHKKEDLSRVEQLLLDWLEQGGGEEIIEYTGTFPMTILANGEPLIDYLISGNTVQNGTPAPDNPTIPQGTGERTRQLITRATFSPNYLRFYPPDLKKIVEAEATFTLSFKSNITFRNNSVYLNTPGYSSRVVATVSGTGDVSTTFTLTETDISNIKNSSEPYFHVYKSDTDFSSSADIMLNTGSTALPYEPYGYKIPISSANTTTPVYLGEVQSTRRIKKLVLTGTEAFYASGSWGKTNTAVYYTTLPNAMNLNTNVVYVKCSHYIGASRNYIYDNDIECLGMTGSNSLTFRVNRQYAGTKEDFLAYLAAQYAAGTPVTVWYVLATEETAVVNEPLMRIGDYADTLSYAQAGADVPTNEKPTETVIDVPTSVKPSEGYIKYTEPTDGPIPKTQVLGTKNHEIYMTSNNEVYVLRR